MACALLVLPSAESEVRQLRPVIAYIGSWEKASDPVFKRFNEAFAKRHPALAERLIFRHFLAQAGDQASIDNAIAQALVSRPVMLVTPTSETAMRAAVLCSDKPFVFSSYADPVANHIRDSLQFSRMANTGVSLEYSIDHKRLEILKDAFPAVHHVAVLADRSWAIESGGAQRVAAAARSLGLELRLVLAESAIDLDRLSLTQIPDAWYIPPTYLAYIAEKNVIAMVKKMRLPAMHSTAAEVQAGALMAYEQDTSFVIDALADLTARVFSGEHAGDIPVERPQRFKLIVRVNHDANLPNPVASVIRRADVVVR